MLTVKHINGFSQRIYSCDELHRPRPDCASFVMITRQGRREIDVHPGDVVYVENGMGKTIDIIRGAEK